MLQDRLGHVPGATVTREYYVQIADDVRKSAAIELPSLGDTKKHCGDEDDVEARRKAA